MMSPHQKAMTIGVLRRALDEMLNMPTTTKCVDCKNYDHLGTCMKWGESIPNDVMGKGCESWDFDPNSPPF